MRERFREVSCKKREGADRSRDFLNRILTLETRTSFLIRELYLFFQLCCRWKNNLSFPLSYSYRFKRYDLNVSR